ncbi:glycosyltransferase [Candidatus Scalindua japonica]|uniref:Glycosyltransferase n=1 Tax=Candidatus Scalindua japonica TaxID=1284222 RepID=A0A286TX50_9BACT|nr:glycosyltransferase [Candidatus Scalindua japonica]
MVDDNSTDNSAEISRQKGFNVFTLSGSSGPKGPAFARNFGVERAQGEIVMFVDSDVLVRPETIKLIVENFDDDNIDAVFGSYDEDPKHKNFISQYKNLFHHFIHQQSHTGSSSFWAGCGAIRRDVFLKAGGFDAKRFIRPSIEDIELGSRLKDMGHKIVLDKSVQVKHLKRWNLYSLIKTDVIDRAIPWIKLIIETNSIPRDLNLKYSYRVSSVLASIFAAFIILLFSGSGTYLFSTWIFPYAVLLLISLSIGVTFIEFYFLIKRFNKTAVLNTKKLLLTLFVGLLTACSIFVLIDFLTFGFFPVSCLYYFSAVMLFFTIILLNSQVYYFFSKKKGIRFAMLVILMHFLYYIYSFLTFITFWPIFKLSKSFKTDMK